MARFESIAELSAFLGKLDPDCAGYAAALWQKGIRTSGQLLHARESILLSAGLPELHIDDIKASAAGTGEQLPYSTCFNIILRRV